MASPGAPVAARSASAVASAAAESVKSVVVIRISKCSGRGPMIRHFDDPGIAAGRPIRRWLSPSTRSSAVATRPHPALAEQRALDRELEERRLVVHLEVPASLGRVVLGPGFDGASPAAQRELAGRRRILMRVERIPAVGRQVGSHGRAMDERIEVAVQTATYTGWMRGGSPSRTVARSALPTSVR